MKHVILLGDSIRLGYRATVAQKLEKVAHVWSPEENCAHSVNILINFRGWLEGRNPDVLHLNCGLHDIRTLVDGRSEILVPLEWYRRNVEAILALIGERCPQAKLIWATTTPVLEEITGQSGRDFQRFNRDIEAANDAAREVCGRLGVEINDLNAWVKENGPANLINPDGVHFSAEGSRILGERVAWAISAEL